MEMGIYCIHDECGRLYYGSTVNFNRRWNEHKSDLRLGKHKNPILQAAYNKYGIDYFTYTIVEIVENRNLLLIREQDWLDWLWKNTTKKTRYNLNKIAEKPPGNKGIFSAETRKKMSDSAKKRVFTPEQRKKQADTQRGKKLTDAVKARWKDILNNYNHKCLSCGTTEYITVDHIKPLSMGGLNTADNVQPLCHTCNSLKRDLEIDYRPEFLLLPSDYEHDYQAQPI